MRERIQDSSLFLSKDNFGNGHWQRGLKAQQAEIALKAQARKITLSAFASSVSSHSKCWLPWGPLKPQGTRSLFKLYLFGNHYSLLNTTCWGKKEQRISATSQRERRAGLSFIPIFTTAGFWQKSPSPCLCLGVDLSYLRLVYKQEGSVWDVGWTAETFATISAFQVHGQHCLSNQLLTKALTLLCLRHNSPKFCSALTWLRVWKSLVV